MAVQGGQAKSRREPRRPRAVGSAATWDRQAKVWRDGEYWYDESAADAAVAFFRDHLVLTEGEWAGRPFILEPWQEHDIVRPAFGWKRPDGTRRYRRCYVWVPRKNGKALDLKTPLPTPRGWTTMGDIRVGDQLIDEKGKPCTVTFATDVQIGRPCYRVSFADGTSIVADAEHRWLAKAAWSKAKVVTTEQMARRLRIDKGYYWSIDVAAGVDGSHADLPVDPWVLGFWLGDGSSRDARITVGREDFIAIEAEMARRGVSMRPMRSGPSKTVSYWMHDRARRAADALHCRLRSLGVYAGKHIPAAYLRGSRAQRLDLLRGLVDSDGHVTKRGQIEIVTIKAALRDGIIELIRSLGFKASCSERRAKLNGKDCGLCYRIQFWCCNDMPIATLLRKAARQKAAPERSTRARRLSVVGIEPVESVPVRCIQVDSPSRLFLAGRGMTPTHNTELAAGIALLVLLGDGEHAGQVYSIATDVNQARLVFDKAAAMVGQSETLSGELVCLKPAIYCAALNASFKPLSGRPKGKHGFSASGLIGDEIHEWDSGELYQFVHDSEAARRQPLEFLISTAGKKGGYGEEAWEECQKIAAGDIEDPETLVVIYAADPEDDWTDPKVWAKANPNLGISKKLDVMETECRRARQLPRLENGFKSYHLNIWTEQATRWLPIDATDDDGNRFGWDQCAGPIEWLDLEERLRGKHCCSGLDLSSTTDLTALVHWFPVQDGLDVPAVLCRFFKPAMLTGLHEKRDKLPYARWAREGALFTTPGNVMDYAYIKAQLFKDGEAFRLNKVAIDRWSAIQLSTELASEGLDVVLFGQGFASMSAPSKELERLVLSNGFHHGGHPVLRRHAQVVAVETDPADNLKPAKNKSTERIDGIVATIMGLGVAMANDMAVPFSPFDDPNFELVA